MHHDLGTRQNPVRIMSWPAWFLFSLAVASMTWLMLDAWWKSTPEYTEIQRQTVEVQQRQKDLDERLDRAEREKVRLMSEIASIKREISELSGAGFPMGWCEIAGIKKEIAERCAAVKLAQPAAANP